MDNYTVHVMKAYVSRNKNLIIYENFESHKTLGMKKSEKNLNPSWSGPNFRFRWRIANVCVQIA